MSYSSSDFVQDVTNLLIELKLITKEQVPDNDTGALADLVVATMHSVADAAKAASPSQGTAWLLVQEGGSSSELYVHGWNTQEEAEDDRVNCTRDGAYRTSPVIEVAANLANHCSFYQTVEALLGASRELDLVEVPPGLSIGNNGD